MTQKDSEIKIIPPRAVSRDFKMREFAGEQPLGETIESVKAERSEEHVSDRREFFKAVLPASGKLLTSFFRELGTTISSAVEDAKDRAKKNSD